MGKGWVFYMRGQENAFDPQRIQRCQLVHPTTIASVPYQYNVCIPVGKEKTHRFHTGDQD